MSKILIDIGSFSTKINFIGEQPLMISSSKDCLFDFQRKGSTIEFYSKFPDATADFPYHEGTFYSRNKIIDDSKYSDFLGHCFNLLKFDPSGHDVIVLTPPIDQKNFITKTSEILFETYNCSKISMLSQSCFANEHKNFVSVMIGFSDTYIIPHINCEPCHKSLRHIPIGGHHITEFISSSLKERPQNQYIDEDDFMWISEQVKLIDRFPFFDSNIDIDDIRHSTPLKNVFKPHPITNQRQYFTFGYERYLAAAGALLPSIIDPSINFTLAEQINDSIKSAIIETNSKSHMEKTLKSKISVVGGPASARGIKYKLLRLFKNTKTKKKKVKPKKKEESNKNDAIKVDSKDKELDKNINIKDEDNKDEDSQDEDIKDEDSQDEDIKDENTRDEDNKDDFDKDDEKLKDIPVKDRATQVFRNASKFYEKFDNIFVSNESYQEDHSNCLVFSNK